MPAVTLTLPASPAVIAAKSQTHFPFTPAANETRQSPGDGNGVGGDVSPDGHRATFLLLPVRNPLDNLEAWRR